MDIDILYAGLYNAHRVSCRRCSDERKKEENYYRHCTEGMQRMIHVQQDGIGLRIKPFSSYEDWQDLVDVINKCPEYGEG